MQKAKVSRNQSIRRRPPALTAEEQEDRMIFLATQLAEQQMIDGTASAQVITHYLKLGSTKERLEKEKLIEENKLLKAKTKAIENDEQNKETYLKAIEAMRIYAGNMQPSSEEIYED